MPDPVKAATNDYCSEQDVVGMFVEECCVKIEGRTKFKAIYDPLESWCGDNGYTTPSRKLVGEYLLAKGYGRDPPPRLADPVWPKDFTRRPIW